MLNVDQPIFASRAELQSLGAIAVIGNDFSRAITLWANNALSDGAGTLTVTAEHQQASILLERCEFLDYQRGSFLVFLGRKSIAPLSSTVVTRALSVRRERMRSSRPVNPCIFAVITVG
jgi:hypothetical protein